MLAYTVTLWSARSYPSMAIQAYALFKLQQEHLLVQCSILARRRYGKKTILSQYPFLY